MNVAARQYLVHVTPLGGRLDLKTVLAEKIADQFAQIGVVIDDEDAGGRGGGRVGHA